MIKKVVIISCLSIICILGLFGTKILNIQNMEAQGRDASSYHDISAYIYTVVGILLCIIAFWTYKIHIVAGIIPWGIGLGSLAYGLYILYAKGAIVLCTQSFYY